MKNEAEKCVSNYYNTSGWETMDGNTIDACNWEDLRPCSAEYVSKCRLRLLEHIPEKGENLLDMGSGPIQYKEYLEYSKGFRKRYCVDLSTKALADAKMKIGDHGVFLCGSFFDIDLDHNFFDCSISLHAIYHIDKDKQEEAVRKLLNVTKPGCPVIIVYSNPNTLISGWVKVFPLHSLFKLFKTGKSIANENRLYFFAHPIKWWHRFSDVADIQILIWRSFASNHQKILIPNNRFGQMLNLLYKMESKYPHFFAKYFQYPMIILKKRFV